MKIYTKTGDKGETSLFGGQRVPKDALRIEAYGTVDELNAQLGVVRALRPSKDVDAILRQLQNDLFALGADLATPIDKQTGKIVRIRQENIGALERFIDTLDAQLPPLTSFILPGGSSIGAQLHVARTICRRAERAVVHLGRDTDIGRPPVIYLNRCSDLLFVLARYANQLDGVGETPWQA